MKRILITGAAGFIGFHLALALKKRGDVVFGLDNFNSYYDPKLKTRRAEILQEQGITITNTDITNSAGVKDLLGKEKITHLVHLAAQAGVRYSLENPQAYVDSNLVGFVNVLEALRLFPEIKLTYASSSSVYGLNTKVPFSEKDPVDQPASLYAATKRSNELLAFSYHNLYKICSTGLRFFTVYGPFGRPDMAYYSFTKALVEGLPITLFGDGQLKRDFTYIDDIIAGTIAAIDKGFACEIFNLGNHHPVTTLELLTTLEKWIGKKGNVRFSLAQPEEVKETYADITKSQQYLGFSPKTDLATGLKKFIDWWVLEQSGL
ncbi:MAG: hypothetical protein RLZZ453_520 [Chlamydiota bacterium]|jgi:UDP-glucuronate 4-epimerase